MILLYVRSPNPPPPLRKDPPPPPYDPGHDTILLLRKLSTERWNLLSYPDAPLLMLFLNVQPRHNGKTDKNVISSSSSSTRNLKNINGEYA